MEASASASLVQMSRRPSPSKSTAWARIGGGQELHLTHGAGPAAAHALGGDVAALQDRRARRAARRGTGRRGAGPAARVARARTVGDACRALAPKSNSTPQNASTTERRHAVARLDRRQGRGERRGSRPPAGDPPAARRRRRDSPRPAARIRSGVWFARGPSRSGARRRERPHRRSRADTPRASGVGTQGVDEGSETRPLAGLPDSGGRAPRTRRRRWQRPSGKQRGADGHAVRAGCAWPRGVLPGERLARRSRRGRRGVGCQPSRSRIRSASATIRAGSPGRRGREPHREIPPETRFTTSITSSTE